MGGAQTELGRASPGRGSGTWGRREETRRPRYLLILCAKARRSAAAMVPRVWPPPRVLSPSWPPLPRPESGQPSWAGREAGPFRVPWAAPCCLCRPEGARGPLPPPRPRGWGGEPERL